jgi:hypothetical protein
MLRNQGLKHKLKICNTYCLSTATMVKLYVYCPSCYHIHVISNPLPLVMDLIPIKSRTALVKGENDHVLLSYTATSLLPVRAIDYYINNN